LAILKSLKKSYILIEQKKYKIGIPAFGFSPINNTPILLHDHNEFLNAKVFLKGIDIMHKLVLDLANMD
jgi:aminoacylase